MDNRPIGVFDSGLGGLTVVKQLRQALPHEDIVYFGDTGRVPYGGRSRQSIEKYARQDIAFLKKQNVKMIIAACGTVSSICGSSLGSELDIPFTGVVVHGAQHAASLTKNKKVGVIGTQATVRSGAYARALKEIRPEIHVYGKACPLFVPLVENGYADAPGEVALLVARDYLLPLKENNIDTLILGCTHYPLLRNVIHQVLGKEVALVDVGEQTARYTAKLLLEQNMACEEKQGTERFFVSDDPDNFERLAESFMGAPLRDITVIDIDILGL